MRRYAHFIKVIQNPDDEEQEALLAWARGSFDPVAFDPTATTTRMRRGLPNREEMD